MRRWRIAAGAWPPQCAAPAWRPATTVAVLAPNIPEMLEAHYGVPMVGAVLHTINIRLDAATIGFILRAWRGEGPDRRSRITGRGRRRAAPADRPRVIDIVTTRGRPRRAALGDIDYEAFIAERRSCDCPIAAPADEWKAIALSYTSGTTGNPKGVVTITAAPT